MGLATFFFWCLEMTSLGYLVCENVVADVSWGISLHLNLMMMTVGQCLEGKLFAQPLIVYL